jgi:hypothetical protein
MTRMKKVYLLLCFVFVTFWVQAQTTNYSVYALYVINIAKYSSWPAIGNELNVAVLGKTKVYDELVKHNGKTVNGHTLKVTSIDNAQNIGSAQILYIADGKSSSLEEVLTGTNGKPVMIICEREGLFKKGAGFSFVVMENNTLRFDINSTELEKRNIKVSKSLSTLANSSI